LEATLVATAADYNPAHPATRIGHPEGLVRTTWTLLLLFFASVSAAQNAPQQPAARTDVYHVHFAAATTGKAAQLGDFLKTPDPRAPIPGHFLVLRHQDGAEWDYVVITHLGTKATVEAAGTPTPPSARDLYAWHTDTFVNGPPWNEFVRAMGIAAPPMSKTAGSVYVVSVYRAAPGHRDQLEKVISEPPSGNIPADTVLMQHLEGGPWNYLTIVRYNSWPDFASSENNAIGQTVKGTGGWFQLREHASFHNDTITDRIAP
jgi:hypothetical protein